MNHFEFETYFCKKCEIYHYHVESVPNTFMLHLQLLGFGPIYKGLKSIPILKTRKKLKINKS